MISSFELGLTWEELNVKILLNSPIRDSSFFTLKLGGFEVTKETSQSASVSLSANGQLKTLEMGFCQLGETITQKLLSLVRIVRKNEPLPHETPLWFSLKMLKLPENGTSKVALRADMGSIQTIQTLGSLSELIRSADKLINYMNKSFFLHPGFYYIRSNNFRSPNEEPNLTETNEDLIDETQFHSFVEQNNLMASFYNSFSNQSLEATNQKSNGNSPETHTPSQTELLKQDLKAAVVDIDLTWQGLYLAFLKESKFKTSDIFDWSTNLRSGEKLTFNDVLCNYFLLTIEEINLSFVSNAEKGTNKASVRSIELLDCLIIDPDTGNVITKPVDIQGLDESSECFNHMDSMDESKFQSVIIQPEQAQYKQHCLLSLEPLPAKNKSSKPEAVTIGIHQGKQNLSLDIAVNIIKIDVDLKTFTLMTNRVQLAEEINRALTLIMKKPSKSFEDYGGISSTEMRQIRDELKNIQGSMSQSNFRDRVLKLFNIKDQMIQKKEEAIAIKLSILKLSLRVGGKFENPHPQGVWMSLNISEFNLNFQQHIILTWKNNIDIYLETLQSKTKLASIQGDKDNLLAIDEQNLVFKLSAILVYFSPAISEGILMLIDLIDSKLTKLDYSQQTFKILPSLSNLQKEQQTRDCIFLEELEINEICKQIFIEIYKVPQLVKRSYVFIGKIGLEIFDEQITKEILETVQKQRDHIKDMYSDWEMPDDDEDEQPENSLSKAVEEKLKSVKVVAHFEVKPIMVKLSDGGLYNILVHTVLLRDGMTAISMLENKLNYQTHFCELYSMHFDQPNFDASTSKKDFDMKLALRSFKMIHKQVSERGPFLSLSNKHELENGMMVEKVDATISSLVFRLGMHTSLETFLCLIKIVDSTLLRLEKIGDTLNKVKSRDEAEEIREFRNHRESKAKHEVDSKQNMPLQFTVKLDSIYLDIFYVSSYRLILKVNHTVCKGSLPNPSIDLDCNGLELAFSTRGEETKSRSLDNFDKKTIFFKILSIKKLVVLLKTNEEKNRLTQDIVVKLPTDEGKNLLMILDVMSITVLVELARQAQVLIENAKKRSAFLFQETTEFVKESVSDPQVDNSGWEKVGVKFQELKSLQDQLSEFVETHYVANDDDSSSKKKASATPESISAKLNTLKNIIESIYIEQPVGKKSTVHLRIFIEKFTANIYQKFDPETSSYVSCVLKDIISVIKVDSSVDSKRKDVHSVTTTSILSSIRSIRVLDKTASSMFKYLFKIPRHSLKLFLRTRDISVRCPKTVQKGSRDMWRVTTTTDKVALMLELQEIRICIDDKSMKSLMDFSSELKLILSSPSSSNKVKDEASIAEEARIQLDYFFLSKLELHLISRAATHVSYANFIPDATLTLTEKFIEDTDPLTQSDLTGLLLDQIKAEISLDKIFKENKGNLPLIASFVTLVSTAEEIYGAITRKDTVALLGGVRDIFLLGLLNFVKAGQFGLKGIADITAFISRLKCY